MDGHSNTTSHHYSLATVLNRPKTALVCVFLMLLIFCTLLGNFLVVWTIFITRRLRYSAFFFVASLAVSDFLVGLFVLPISLGYHLAFEMRGRWIFGSFFCKAWLSANFWFCSASVLNLCLVSWDRYVAVTSPLRYKVRMCNFKVRRMIAVSWTLSLAIAVILISKARRVIESRTNCTLLGLEDPIFTSLGIVLVLLLPASFLVFVNTRVWIVARGHRKRIRNVNENSAARFHNSSRETFESTAESTTGSVGGSQRSFSQNSPLTTTIKQEIRTFKTFLVVIGVFLVCWIPFFALLLQDLIEPLSSFVVFLTIVLTYCNSAMNVFIYGIFNREFRIAMKAAILKC